MGLKLSSLYIYQMKNSIKAILYRVVMIKKVQSLGKAADTGMSEQKKKKGEREHRRSLYFVHWHSCKI